jgi:hypothetical protein
MTTNVSWLQDIPIELLAHEIIDAKLGASDVICLAATSHFFRELVDKTVRNSARYQIDPASHPIDPENGDAVYARNYWTIYALKQWPFFVAARGIDYWLIVSYAFDNPAFVSLFEWRMPDRFLIRSNTWHMELAKALKARIALRQDGMLVVETLCRFASRGCLPHVAVDLYPLMDMDGYISSPNNRTFTEAKQAIRERMHISKRLRPTRAQYAALIKVLVRDTFGQAFDGHVDNWATNQ